MYELYYDINNLLDEYLKRQKEYKGNIVNKEKLIEIGIGNESASKILIGDRSNIYRNQITLIEYYEYECMIKRVKLESMKITLITLVDQLLDIVIKSDDFTPNFKNKVQTLFEKVYSYTEDKKIKDVTSIIDSEMIKILELFQSRNVNYAIGTQNGEYYKVFIEGNDDLYVHATFSGNGDISFQKLYGSEEHIDMYSIDKASYNVLKDDFILEINIWDSNSKSECLEVVYQNGEFKFNLSFMIDDLTGEKMPVTGPCFDKYDFNGVITESLNSLDFELLKEKITNALNKEKGQRRERKLGQ